MLEFLMSDKVLNFDLGVFESVQKLWSPVLNVIMEIITRLGDEGIIWILLGLVLFCIKKYRKIGFTMLVALVVMVLCNNLVLKDLIARPRPYNIGEFLTPEKASWWFGIYKFPEIVPPETSFSFPSGHTSSSIAASLALLWYDRKYGIPALVLGVLIAFSRIYVAVHYCSDVFAGVIVGIIYAFIGILAAKLIFPRLEPLFDRMFDKIKELWAKLKAKKA